VELLLALLRSVLCPADPVPLVSCLRSALGAVPDRELQQYALDTGSGRSAWRLEARPDPERFPGLARALDGLRRFAAAHRGEAIDRLAQAALVETPLRLVVAATYGGAQRLANLEKAVRRVAELARGAGAGRGGEAAILERIEAEEAREAREGDSPLADETLDAIRVLSIHRAKGLEWDLVIVPDLAGEIMRSGGKGDFLVVTPPPQEAEAAAPALAIRAERIETPAAIVHRVTEEEERRAEIKRLFYVAATRARERLVLVAGPQARSGESWLEPLGAWGYSDRTPDEVPAVEDLHGGAVRHLRVAGREEAGRSERAETVPETLVEAARRFEAARDRVQAAAAGVRSPSAQEQEGDAARGSAAGVAAAGGEGGQRRPVGRGPSVARAAGAAVHLLLEAWDRGAVAWLFENAAAAVRITAGDERCDPRVVEREVEAILQRAKRDGRLDALRALPVLASEVPFVYEDEKGQVWAGRIDLLAGTAVEPEVVDFKTDAPGGAADPEERHAGQLSIYARAVQRAAGLLIPPPAKIQRL
jgi:ATP-dependent helicase/nuclease subunit A